MRVSVLLALVCAVCGTASADRWPGFLGAGATDVSPAAIPLTWSPKQNIGWTAEIPGYGQSSPVIWDDSIYVTSVDGADKESNIVSCYSLESGEQRWTKSLSSSFPVKNSVYVSRAAPTPVLDDRAIYAYFESGDVVAYAHDGALLWSVSLTEKYGQPQNEFGLSASPVQTEDRLIILIDDEGPSYLVALNKADGSEQWRIERTSRKSWSSPMLVPDGDDVQVVCSSDGSVDGFDVDTGERLWTYGEVGGNTSTSPVPVGDRAFLVSASPGRDGKNAELSRKSNGLFFVDQEGGQWKPGFRWTNPAPTPSWGSPIVHQGHAYWVNRSGVVYCLDATTGEAQYAKRLEQGCWATPVGIGDRIYVFGKNGLTTVINVGQEFEVLATNRLWPEDKPPVNNVPTAEEETEERRRAAAMFSRPTVYGVAITNGQIILRTGSQLFSVGDPKNAQADAARIR